MNKRAQSRSAARLAAVQALYQHEMEATPVAKLIHEFHQHRIGAIIEDAEYADADLSFFDDIVKGALARLPEVDAAITARLASGWTMERLDRTMKAILRAGTYELIARGDVPIGAVVSEYVDVAKAFFDTREAGFANGLLDAIGKSVRGTSA
ncbi:transcription antitermination factor NusB [Sphingopyxis macrogoltabida]|uniref:Transcription antitermination protein NusB n=1 Tax=Sphingopyxis macrogoltabida TaxID=33050 RepID=A0A0N9UZM7_SPHMC|nr:transcription antitermination factor NusB [Sphingopyxis macrogoltabida]ALH81370.1 antitermination protein NusB [Sphingopyxis macrogoltabida]